MNEEQFALIDVDKTKCRRDGICAAVCPLGLIVNGPDGPVAVAAAAQQCIECGHCVAICPAGALSLRSVKASDCQPIPDGWRLSPEVVEPFLKARRSIRTYQSRPVDRGTLGRVIDFARYAPSGVNRQPVRWLVVQEREEVRRLAGIVVDWMRGAVRDNPALAGRFGLGRLVAGWDAGRDPVCRNAPNLIVAYASSQDPIAPGACMIALSHLEIAALPFGLGTCWAGYVMMAASQSPAVAAALDLPAGQAIFGAMMIGYPRFDYHRIPPRRPADIRWC
jgi:nitroreductase/NAD-dependent dihydropyrimidine dehydrogenase PreA subunit